MANQSAMLQANQQQCFGTSLCIFKADNCIRIFISDLLKNKLFEAFIILLIVISSILLAMDNPLHDPKSNLVYGLNLSDIVLTSFFIAEAAIKIIASGFLINGENSYLRNGWNFIDFVVVITSTLSLVISGYRLKIIKIFRLLRVMRPLRVISRNKGLKIGIQALFMAIPSLFNVLIISLMFFLICGVIGVNYFKGSFFSCVFGTSFPQDYTDNTQLYVVDKFDCINLGGTWENADSNFDNVFQAMSTLFQISTTEGWVDIMYQGVDSIGIDYQP